MNIVITEDYASLSTYVANEVVTTINENKQAVLGLPTGGTPEGMYKELVKMYSNGEVDFSTVKTFNLDEYIGLPKDHPQSYSYYMKKNLFEHVNLKHENVYIPTTTVQNMHETCEGYERKIDQAGGFDITILGIGLNGHIGFNEPGSSQNDKTRVVDLDKSTITANARYFNSIEEVPNKAITIGISTILKSKRIIVLASGANKSEIMNEFLKHDPTSEIPATFLKLHPNVQLVLDKDASSKLDQRSLCTTF
ncbi:MAG: glucosamine-6-phosphate deaminase [Bacillaceae bacterium]|nr:glucosamine-6-phosphate deaminase [Bacillaceae bacterium]